MRERILIFIVLAVMKYAMGSINDKTTSTMLDLFKNGTSEFAKSQCVVIMVAPNFAATILSVKQSEHEVPLAIKKKLIETNTTWLCRKHHNDSLITDLCCANVADIGTYEPLVLQLASFQSTPMPSLNKFLADWYADDRRNQEIIKNIIVGATMILISISFFICFICLFCPCCPCCRLRRNSQRSNRSTRPTVTSNSSRSARNTNNPIDDQAESITKQNE